MSGSGRPIALLSLFDGSGMARVGILRILQRIGKPEALIRTWTVEINPKLATAAQLVANTTTASTNGTVDILAHDVWEVAGPANPRLRDRTHIVTCLQLLARGATPEEFEAEGLLL